MSINSDAIQKKLQGITGQLSGDVSLKRLFKDDFIQQCSKYASAQEFFSAAGVSSQEIFDRWMESDADSFVLENTSFYSWNAFLGTAAREFAREKRLLLSNGQWQDEEFGDLNQFENIHIYLNFRVG